VNFKGYSMQTDSMPEWIIKLKVSMSDKKAIKVNKRNKHKPIYSIRSLLERNILHRMNRLYAYTY
jgi:hypothetical protein